MRLLADTRGTPQEEAEESAAWGLVGMPGRMELWPQRGPRRSTVLRSSATSRAQRRKVTWQGLASSGAARSPLDMTLYMTATAASNKDIEKKLSGKIESGTMRMELLFNKLSGSAKGLP